MGKKIHIKDAGMRRALDCHQVSIVNDRVDADELAKLDSLDWGSTGIGEDDPILFHYITSLNGLQYAKKLKTLGLNGHRFRTLAPLANLREIEELWLYDNDLRNISALRDKDKLRILDLSLNSHLKDISSLEGLPNLEVLHLSATKVSDITVLDTLPRLREAKLSSLEFKKETQNWETLLNLLERDVQVTVDDKYREQLEKDLAKRKPKASLASDELSKRLTELDLPDLAFLWCEKKEKAEDKKGNNLFHLLLQKALPTDVTLSLIELFVTSGVEINKESYERRNATPLTLAMSKGHDISVVTKLIDNGASLSLPDKCPPLRLALDIYEKNNDYLNLLLERGADLTCPATFDAIIKKGSFQLFEEAMEAGANVNGQFDSSPPLNGAAFAGRAAFVKRLLAAGADPNGLDDLRRNPLFLARSKKMFDLLLEAGSNPLTRTFGSTPLFSIGDWGLESESACADAEVVVEKLVELGVDVNARNGQQRTALCELSTKDRGDTSKSVLSARLLEKLIQLGAHPNILDRYGKTPLDLAMSDNVKKTLIKHKGTDGNTYIDRLLKLVNEEVVPGNEAWHALVELIDNDKASEFDESIQKRIFTLLQERGTKTAIALTQLPPLSPAAITYLSGGACGQNIVGDTVLHLVLQGSGRTSKHKGHKIKHEIAELLIDEGADVEVLNIEGKPSLYPYFYSTEEYSLDLVKRLATENIIDYPLNEPLLEIIATKRSHFKQRKKDLSTVDEVIDHLLTKGPNLTPPQVFHSLCRSGRLDIVKKAVAAGADPLATKLPIGNSLRAAVMGDSEDVIRYLLEDIKMSVEAGYETFGKAPIHETCSIEVLELLLEKGARVDIRTSQMGSLPIVAIADRYNVDGQNMVAMMKRLTSLGQSLKACNDCGTCAEDALRKRTETEIKEYLSTIEQ